MFYVSLDPKSKSATADKDYQFLLVSYGADFAFSLGTSLGIFNGILTKL
ncbi:MAG: hypothetical protein HC832_05390 [Leptolyngbyaceae cyanobacterium RM1_405_57]|nr:hypothetical protein [Leptolyngbyaceae cyanobacterium RM1_405_57]